VEFAQHHRHPLDLLVSPLRHLVVFTVNGPMVFGVVDPIACVVNLWVRTMGLASFGSISIVFIISTMIHPRAVGASLHTLLTCVS